MTTPSSLEKTLARLREDARTNGDAVFHVSTPDGEVTELRSYRFLLTAASERFAAMFNGGWKESTSTLPIQVTDVAAVTFDNLLEWLHTATLPQSDLELLDLRAAANMYVLTELERACVGALMARMTGPGPAMDIMDACFRFGKLAVHFTEDVLPLAYLTLARGLDLAVGSDKWLSLCPSAMLAFLSHKYSGAMEPMLDEDDNSLTDAYGPAEEKRLIEALLEWAQAQVDKAEAQTAGDMECEDGGYISADEGDVNDGIAAMAVDSTDEGENAAAASSAAANWHHLVVYGPLQPESDSDDSDAEDSERTTTTDDSSDCDMGDPVWLREQELAQQLLRPAVPVQASSSALVGLSPLAAFLEPLLPHLRLALLDTSDLLELLAEPRHVSAAYYLDLSLAKKKSAAYGAVPQQSLSRRDALLLPTTKKFGESPVASWFETTTRRDMGSTGLEEGDDLGSSRLLSVSTAAKDSSPVSEEPAVLLFDIPAVSLYDTIPTRAVVAVELLEGSGFVLALDNNDHNNAGLVLGPTPPGWPPLQTQEHDEIWWQLRVTGLNVHGGGRDKMAVSGAVNFHDARVTNATTARLASVAVVRSATELLAHTGSVLVLSMEAVAGDELDSASASPANSNNSSRGGGASSTALGAAVASTTGTGQDGSNDGMQVFRVTATLDGAEVVSCNLTVPREALTVLRFCVGPYGVERSGADCVHASCAYRLTPKPEPEAEEEEAQEEEEE